MNESVGYDSKKIIVKSIGGQIFSVDVDVFTTLLDFTVVCNDRLAVDAVNNGYISLSDLKSLFRRADVPYPLVFVDLAYAKSIVDKYKSSIFKVVSRDSVSVASRGQVDIRDISLIIKDIVRKQDALTRLNRGSMCEIPRILLKSEFRGMSLANKANYLRGMVGYDIDTVCDIKGKQVAFDYLSDRLAAKNVFISVYGRSASPQYVRDDGGFSGIAVSNKHYPFLFVRTCDDGMSTESWGRRMFTAVLLLFCLALRKNGPVTVDGIAADNANDELYVLVEEFMVPSEYLKNTSVESLERVMDLANKFKISPTAMVMRLARLGIITLRDKEQYLSDLKCDYDRRSRNRFYRPNVARELSYYNNPHCIAIVSDAVKAKKIDIGRARGLLCYRKGSFGDLTSLSGW